MAAATVTATLYGYPKGVDNTQRLQVLRGTLAVGFGTYPPGGFPINWAGVKNSDGGQVESIPIGSASTIVPIEVDVQDVSPTPSGFVFVVDNLGNLHVFISANGASGTSGPLIEGVGPNANVPGALNTATIQFTAYFVRE